VVCKRLGRDLSGFAMAWGTAPPSQCHNANSGDSAPLVFFGVGTDFQPLHHEVHHVPPTFKAFEVVSVRTYSKKVLQVVSLSRIKR
jgi:hypothetical protein